MWFAIHYMLRSQGKGMINVKHALKVNFLLTLQNGGNCVNCVSPCITCSGLGNDKWKTCIAGKYYTNPINGGTCENCDSVFNNLFV